MRGVRTFWAGVRIVFGGVRTVLRGVRTVSFVVGFAAGLVATDDRLLNFLGQVGIRTETGDRLQLRQPDGGECRAAEAADLGLLGDLDRVERLAIDDGDIAADIPGLAVLVGEYGSHGVEGLLEPHSL